MSVGTTRPEVWSGPECSFLKVGGHVRDQLRETGHDGRLEDLDQLAALGVSALRYPVLWGRGGDPGATDWAWAETRLERLERLGVRPIVGLLHHGYGPIGLDPRDPGWPAAFGRYAASVATRFPRIAEYLPINEPLVNARFGGLYGWWTPGARSFDVFVDLVLAQARAWQAAARGIRSVRPGVRLIANEDAGRTEGTTACRAAVAHDNRRRWLTFDLVTGRVGRDHRLWKDLGTTAERRRILDELVREPEVPDILGIDYYLTSDRFLDHRLSRYPPVTHGGDGRMAYADVELARIAGQEPVGFARPLRETLDRYGLPVAITEVHLAGSAHDHVAWWADAWSAARAATATGGSVVGVTSWAAFGAVDWDSVLTRHPGTYAPGLFDVSSGEPQPTQLAGVVSQTAAGVDPEPGGGWWQEPGREAA